MTQTGTTNAANGTPLTPDPSDERGPASYPADRPSVPAIRSRLMLEVASELVGSPDWRDKQLRVDMRPQGSLEWRTSLFASDGQDAVPEVLSGRTHFAILNPASVVRSTMRRQAGEEGVLAAIATIPSYDQLAFAVRRELGVTTLEEFVAAAPPVAVSLRGGRPNHSVHVAIDDVLQAVGIRLSDIESWGGTLRRDDGMPAGDQRMAGLHSGEVDAIFDEGVNGWVDVAAEEGLRFLSIGDETLRRLEALGYRRSVLSRRRHPSLAADVQTVDFSGFLLYTRADADHDLVRAFCGALAARRHRIAWQGGPELPLERMVTDSVDAPLPIPLHPAAASYWREIGLL